MLGPGSLRDRLRADSTAIIGPLVLLVVRQIFSPSWWLPWTLVVGALTLGRHHVARSVGSPILLAAAFLLLARPDFGRPPPTTSGRVVCLGDSITAGSRPGAPDAFPTWLARSPGWDVVNAGAPNDTVGDLLVRVDAYLEPPPDVVLVLIGGNDDLEGSGTFPEQLPRLLSRISEAGARPVLVEVPSGLLVDSRAGIYRGAARRSGAILVPSTQMRLWLLSELLFRSWLANPLTVDGVHPNERGARAYAAWLEPYVARALSGPR